MLFLDKKSEILFSSFKKESSAGFTLIEVLVVIVIIAVLITISLTFIDRYQSKANDTAIGANLSQIRKVAIMIYIDKNSYENICVNGTLNDGFVEYPQLKTIEDKVREIVGANPDCFSAKREYCVQSELISGEYFCIDSVGFANKIDASVCSSENIKCR